MPDIKQKALLFHKLSDKVAKDKVLSHAQAVQVFDFFKTNLLFKWSDVNNNCEGRAEAISILLEEWKITNYKGWVLGGGMLKKGPGSLRNNWKYHVAALLPVQEKDEIVYYIIDPATSDKLETLSDWAHSVTAYPLTYYLIKRRDHYIFMPGKIKKNNWFERSSQNYKWTMQGLSGINGLSSTGKAYLSFNKKKISRTEKKFSALKKSESPFLF